MLDLGEATPAPVSVLVDDFDSMRRRSLDAIPAVRFDRDDLLETVDVELRRLARSLVGGHFDVERLPLLPDRVSEAPESHEAAMCSRDLLDEPEPEPRAACR